MFGFKKQTNSIEHSNVLNMLMEQGAAIALLKSEVMHHEVQIKNLRGIINKRLYKDSPELDDFQQEKETEKDKNPHYFNPFK